MACNFYTIRIVAGNSFTLVLPLKMRTYLATVPFDEDIDIMALVGCKVTIGGVEYACTLDPSGVQVAVPDGLAQGTYDIILTAEYHGAQIRAAYFEALQSVAYNKDSDAVQYIAGSPIVAQAAYVIGGALTDAELEALKAEYRQKIADAEAAEAAAEAAKEAYDRKAEQLDDVAKQTTLTQGILDIRGDISGISIDTTSLAKQGDNPSATNTAILMRAQQLPTLQDIQNAGMVQVSYDGVQFTTPITFRKLSDILFNIKYLEEIIDNEATEITTNLNIVPFRAAQTSFQGFVYLRKIVAPNVVTIPSNFAEAPNATVLSALEYIDLRSVREFIYRSFYSLRNLEYLNILNAVGGNQAEFTLCNNLIDIVYGAGLTNDNSALSSWSPTNALSNASNSLVKQGEQFASNLEKLLYNIREHIASNLRTDVGNRTLKFSAEVKAAIVADPATMAAFPANWTIA